MKKKILSIVMALCMALSLVPALGGAANAASAWDGTIPTANATATFSGGDGSITTPYIINTAADLALLSANVTAGTTYSGEYFNLTDDIDLNSGVTFSALDADTGLVTVTNGTTTLYLGTGIKGDISSANTTFDTTASTAGAIYCDKLGASGTDTIHLHSWLPIGTGSTSCFSGTFDGQGHTVNGLYFNNGNSNCIGLFGFTSSTLKNVGVVNSYFHGGYYVGGITAYNNGGTVMNCWNSGSFSVTKPDGSEVGGITGFNNGGTVMNCWSSGIVSGDTWVGGIVGYDYLNSPVYNCYSTGLVNGRLGAGGVVGCSNGSGGNCYWLTGSASSGVGFGTAITCYSFSNSGTTWTLSNSSSYSLTPASGSGSVSVPKNCSLLDALNSWVNTTNYYTWETDSSTGMPIFGALYTPRLTGTPTVAVTEGYGMSSNQIKIGAKLTATPNSDPYSNFSYQWEVASIGTDSWTNATGSGNAAAVYTVAAADVAKQLRVKVTSGDIVGSVYSENSAQVPYTITLKNSGNTGTDAVSLSSSPSVTTAYAVSGSVPVYYTLDSSGTQSNSLTYSGGTITQVTTPGTDSSTYTVNNGDATSGVVAITATFSHTNLAVLSGTPTVAVTNGYGTGSDQIKIGATLTATANATPNTNLSYQWEVSANGSTGWTNATGSGNGTAIYTVAAADVTKYIHVKVTSTDASGAIYSSASAQVPYTITLSESGKTGTDAVSFSNSTSVTTTYAVSGSVTVYYTLSGSGTLSNTLTYTGGTTTQVATPGTASSTYTVNSADASSGFIAITGVFAHTNSTGGGSTTTSSPSTTGAPIIIGGETYNAGDSVNSTDNGKTVQTVTVDTSKLDKLLDASDFGANVIIPVTGGSDVAAGVLTGEMVKNMEAKEATLEIQTDSATYTLPASEINIDAVSKQLGQSVALSDIKVEIQIATPSTAMVSVANNAATSGGYTLVVPAVEYTINCSYSGQTVVVSNFNSYVERTIAIPDGVDPAKITTGVVVNANGTVHQEPTKITSIDGKYYAVISSLTNSTYTVIYNPVEFADVTSHWAKSSIDDMGSRMIISGVGNNNFEPDRDITRAEFAAIAVRALGLTPGTGDKTFSDVANTDWYCPYIETAAASGLITGFADDSFAPNDKITREQAMTIIARAMKITKLDTTLTSSQSEALLAGYTDASDANAYAVPGIASCLQTGVVNGRTVTTLCPTGNITRAEVAVIIQRLLQKSNLI